jgi:O-antigen ligase
MYVTPDISLPRADFLAQPAERKALEWLRPNVIVCWAFYLSIFAIPFTRLYLPGTGDRLGVTRLVQVLILGAVLSQPRVCIRFVPTALFWFLAYCVARVVSGLWLTPELRLWWWPDTLHWLQFSLPWLWIMFNVLQFPDMGWRGLWALAWGCSLCGLLHLAGIGVVEVDRGIEGRSSVFGENANVIGATYATAAIALIGLGMVRAVKLSRRLLVLPLIGIVAVGLAKTGSRTAVLMLAVGIGVLLFQGKSFGSRTKRVGLLLVIGAVLAGVVWQIPTVKMRFQQLDASNLQQQEGRARMIPVLWEIFQRSPIHGSGPSGYQFELTRRAMPYLIQKQTWITAHNLALLLLVETGIIGFLLFAAGVKPALVAAWKARLKSCGSLPLALLVPLLIAGFIVSDPSHHMVFWFAMAYALAGGKTC